MRERLKIAVCDDEPRALTIVSSSIGTVFAEAGMDVSLETFLGPEALLEALSTRSFQLVFLDISMPKNGRHQPGQDHPAAGQRYQHRVRLQPDGPDVRYLCRRPFGFVRKNHFMGT